MKGKLGKGIGSMLLAGVVLVNGVGTPLSVEASSITELEKSKHDIKSKKQEAEKKLEQKEKDIELQQEKLDAEVEKILELNDEITMVTRQVEELESNIEKLEKEINELKEDIRLMTARIEERDGIIQERLRAAQVNEGSMNYLDVLLNATSIVDLVERYTAVKTVVSADKDIMDLQIADKGSLEKIQEKVQQKREELSKDKEGLEGKLSDLEKAKKEKDELVKKMEEEQVQNIEDKVNLEGELIDLLVLEGDVEASIIEEQLKSMLMENEMLYGKFCNSVGEVDLTAFKERIDRSGALSGYSDTIIKMADKYGIDPVLVGAIMIQETGNGTSNAVKNYNNPGGMMNPKTNWSTLIRYDSMEQGIESMSKTLHRIIVKEGRTTISQIGNVYAPLGADNDPRNLNQYWIPNVTGNVQELGGLVKDCTIKTGEPGIATGNFIMPTEGRVTSHFGMRFHPIREEYAQHRGMDIANAKGTPVRASDGGIVTEARSMGTFGSVIMLTHVRGGGEVYTTVYAHLDEIGVRKGERVGQGDLIGKMGATGGVTGTHLHFEVHEGFYSGTGNSAKNPLRYLMSPKLDK